MKTRPKEIRAYNLGDIEIRKTEAVSTLVGKIPFNSRSVNLGGFYEVIKPSAFRKTLKDGSRVVALRNHNDDQILGSTKSGTLRLTEEEDGLKCEVDLPSTQYASDLAEVVSRGDVNTMSFGFYAIQDDISMNGQNEVIRDLLEVRLFEVSFGVVFPAYEETTTEVRKRISDYIEKRNEEMQIEENRDQPGATTDSEELQDAQTIESGAVDSTRTRILRLKTDLLERGM